MVRYTQTIRRLLPTNCLSVFDHFVRLALKGLENLVVFSFCTKGLTIITSELPEKQPKRIGLPQKDPWFENISSLLRKRIPE